MNRYKSDTSMNVSTQISKYILNKAKDLYINRLRTQAIQQKSFEINKQYPKQCTIKIIQLCKFSPNQASPKLNQDFQLNPPAKCRDINGSSVKTTCASSPRLSTKTYTNCKTSVRNDKKEENTNFFTNRTFLPLICLQEEDEEIQILRQKKQKIEILEKFFEESQKKQRSKLKLKITETINNNFTTDFNGDKLEMKTSKRKKTIDPYLMIEMSANLSEERSENKLNLREARNTQGAKKNTKLSDINNIYRQQLSKGRASKISKISKNIEGLEFKQIENMLNIDNIKKNYGLNRKSRLKMMPQMMSINLIKC